MAQFGISSYPALSSYPTEFETAMVRLFEDEGGYSNDPDDPGGETKYGISKAAYPNVDIKNLTKDQAKAIYWKDWWKPYQDYGLVSKLVQKMFNVAVNTGRKPIDRFLQRALRVGVDGNIGPITKKAIAADPNPDLTLWALQLQQAAYYEGLAQGNPTLRKFLNGWLKRAAE
jgi:lysozyme family protein